MLIVSPIILLANNQTRAQDKSINIWNIDTGECIRTLAGHWNWVSSLQNNNHFARGSRDKTK